MFNNKSTDYLNKAYLKPFRFSDYHQKFRINSENPINKYGDSKDPLVIQMVSDIRQWLRDEEQRKMWLEIEEFIENEKLEISEKNKDEHILKAMATFATSKAYYGPVVSDWAHSLLDTAAIENRKLIFLARDGVAPYLVCKLFKENEPEKYHNIDLSLIYVSRTIAYSSIQQDEEISSADSHVVEYLKTLQERDPDILQKYILQETSLKPGEKCLFVDVGFGGSIIRPIKRQLKPLQIDAQFCYLISHTTTIKVKKEKYRARGFLAHLEERPLDPVNKAGGNPAVHWIEDTHQDVLSSPKILIRESCGKIVPATVTVADGNFTVKKLHESSCKHRPEQFLVKAHGLKGVLEAAKRHKFSNLTQEAWRPASEELREFFAKFLTLLKNKERHLLIPHD